jgi:hypothetical protein
MEENKTPAPRLRACSDFSFFSLSAENMQTRARSASSPRIAICPSPLGIEVPTPPKVAFSLHEDNPSPLAMMVREEEERKHRQIEEETTHRQQRLMAILQESQHPVTQTPGFNDLMAIRRTLMVNFKSSVTQENDVPHHERLDDVAEASHENSNDNSQETLFPFDPSI